MNIYLSREDLKMIDTHTLFIWVKTWWISLTGAITSFMGAWFSGGLMLFIDPNIASDLAKVLGAAFSVLIGGITLIYTLKERKKKEQKLQLEIEVARAKAEADKEANADLHVITIVRALEDAHLLNPDLPMAEKIEIALTHIKKIR